jgi:hypothetical protein
MEDNDLLDEQQWEIEELKRVLRLVEFGSCDGCGRGHFCYWCSIQDEFNFEMGHHMPECPVGKALA